MSTPETDATAAPEERSDGDLITAMQADIAAEKAEEAEEARALTAGWAVYKRIVEAEASGKAAKDEWLADLSLHTHPPSPDTPTVNITPAEFRDWQTWLRTYGGDGATFALPLSFEFTMFSGAVLVVVR
jgi:hypothetical protein